MDERYAETLRKQEEKKKQIKGEKYVATKPKSPPNKKFEKIKDTFITLGCIIGIILIILSISSLMDFVGIETGGVSSDLFDDDFKEVDIGGLTFNIPASMILEESGENKNVYFNNYAERDGDKSWDWSRLIIGVYKNASVEQVFSNYKSNYDLLDPANTTIGNYSGIHFAIEAGGWDNIFVFEKSGKTVVVLSKGPYSDEVLLRAIN
jgi:hypothetical protein